MFIFRRQSPASQISLSLYQINTIVFTIVSTVQQLNSTSLVPIFLISRYLIMIVIQLIHNMPKKVILQTLVEGKLDLTGLIVERMKDMMVWSGGDNKHTCDAQRFLSFGQKQLTEFPSMCKYLRVCT